MASPYFLLANIAGNAEMPHDGTLSRTIFQDAQLKAVLFSFSAGQELSEHTASVPAIMHFLQGEADVTLGSEQQAARAGTWIHMEAKLPHSIRAKTPVVMLLLIFKQPVN